MKVTMTRYIVKVLLNFNWEPIYFANTFNNLQNIWLIRFLSYLLNILSITSEFKNFN